MERSPGWIVLAAKSLELAALALASRAMGMADTNAPRRTSSALDFLSEISDEGARRYRASDGTIELFAGLYSDGRIRLVDASGRRFAGALQGDRANVLDLQTRNWSQIVLRTTPTGRLQFDFHGEPYGQRVLNCETLHA